MLNMELSTTSAILSGILVFLLLWHCLENRQLKRHLVAENTETKWLRRLMNLAWFRTIQVILVFSGLLALQVASEFSMAELRTTNANLQHSLSESASALQEAKDTISQNTTDQAAAVAAQAVQPAQPAAEPTAPDTVNSVFGVTATNSDPKTLDGLKQRYEELLVSYMYLKKCKLTKQEDYHVINSALSREMASINAPGRLQFDTLTAARGSFKEVYSSTPCDQKGVPALSQNFRKYIDNITTQAE